MAGDLLVTEKGEGRRIWYYYDSAANPVSMRVSGKDYFYVRNLQNDVIAAGSGGHWPDVQQR